MKVGVLAPETSWHFADLKRACASSDVETELISVDFTDLAAAVGTGDDEQFFDGSKSVDCLDALIVRTMPSGSLQQVIFRMDVLHRMAAAGVCVINPPRSVEIAIDKYLSLSLMAAAGIPVPQFKVCQTVEQGLDAFAQLGSDVVLKPIFGSMGKNIHRIQKLDHAKTLMRDFVQRGEVLYLQKFIDHGGNDIRILVVGSETFAMRRVNEDGGWLTNVARGGIAQPHEPLPQEVELARSAAAANHCRIAGVDMVYQRETQKRFVLEVNASPGWEAIQKVSARNVAAEILRFAQSTSQLNDQPNIG